MRVLAVAVLVAALLGVAHASTARVEAMKALARSGELQAAIDTAGIEAAAGNVTDFIMVKPGAQYIALTCLGIMSIITAAAPSNKAITIDLPCAAGSVKVSGVETAWTAAPVYNCTGGPRGMLSSVWEPQAKGAKITIRAYTTKKNCAKDVRVKIFGGGVGAGAGNDPFFTFAAYDEDTSLFASATLQSIEFDGEGTRPLISVDQFKSLTMKNVFFSNGFASNGTGPVEISDTPTTWTCTKTVPCDVANNKVLTGAMPNMGLGGAVYMTSQFSTGKFSAKYVNFKSNSAVYGGAYYILKQKQKAVSVSFSNCIFSNNTVTKQGSVGFSWRNDGDPYAGDKGAPQALKVTTTGSSVTGAPAGINIIAGVYANQTGSQGGFVPMPWNSKSYTVYGPKGKVFGSGDATLGGASDFATAWGLPDMKVDYFKLS